MRKRDHCRLASTTLPAWATSWQGYSRHHCRFVCQAASVVEAITAGLREQPTVFPSPTQPAWSTGRQWWLDQHSRLEPQSTVLAGSTLLARATNWQCWLGHHCRLELRANNVGSTRHCQVVSGTDTLAWTSLAVLSYRQWCPICHCRFKIR
jgi:hypothetical protein